MNCKHCNEPIEPNWDECPACGAIIEKELKCHTCGMTLKPNWIKCPSCKTPTKYNENRTNIINGENKIQIEMVLVEEGSCLMGEEDEKRFVEIKKFLIGKYPVIQKQWIEIMGNNPSEFKGHDLPVDGVSWHDAQEFIEKLNEKTGKNYRLPTEPEWEWAARGGNKSGYFIYSGSNDLDLVGWYDANSNGTTHPVGQKLPNELEIYDLSGNVHEWCEDWFDDEKKYKVIRGGSWLVDDIYSRVSNRGFSLPTDLISSFGFRLAHDY